MTDARDRRQFERYSNEEPVIIYTKDNPEMAYYGLTYNYSERGMYLETDADLEVGKYYIVKMLSFYSDAKGPEPYLEHCGAVRWIQEIKSEKDEMEGEPNYTYGYGLEYA